MISICGTVLGVSDKVTITAASEVQTINGRHFAHLQGGTWESYAGFLLINQLMDEVGFERNGTEIHMRRY